MSPNIDQISRRDLLLSLSALATASGVRAQSSGATMPVRSLSHMTLTVTDVKRSLEFYQGLFGMPIQVRQGSLICLQIGSGPEFIALGGGNANAKPGINHYCVTVDNFNVDRALKILAGHGVTKADAPTAGGGGGLSGGAMKARVRMRGPEVGGAKDGTAELYVGDPDGIVVQIQDTKYCGGAGSLGEVCPSKPEPAPGKGLIAVRDLSHFTLSVSDAQRSMAFYQDVFAMPIQAHQGPTPLLGVGSGGQFLTLAGLPAGRGGAAAPPRMPNINHVSFRMEGFNPDKVMKTLADFGVTPRGDATGPVGPLKSYVSMRMENRGGAKEGTPELYFTDPDGILLQIQDVSYCGGSGVFGEVCRP
jgi:catechol 2,3-dioxygenase-like lactoylglutathione lyase family enzyme